MSEPMAAMPFGGPLPACRLRIGRFANGPSGCWLKRDLAMTSGTSTLEIWRGDAKDWNGKHDEWLQLLIGCKAVGISLADFIAWCVTDARYADDANKIARKWHSVVAKHGGAFGRELSRRKIKIGRTHNNSVEVPNVKRKAEFSHKPTRNPDARLNYIGNRISENPTERALFSWACLAAEIIHECKRSPTQIMRFLEGAAMGTPLWKTLGRDGVRRTISNAFRKVEEKYLTEEETNDA
jgi:hypothetical protein